MKKLNLILLVCFVVVLIMVFLYNFIYLDFNNEKINDVSFNKNSSTVIIPSEITNTSCISECNFSGEKSCSGNGYRLCGNYDEDECLEWKVSNSNCSESYFCFENVCVNPNICTDSDEGGLNQIYLKGAVFKINETQRDSCVDNKTIIEYSCIGGKIRSSKYSCGANYLCLEGVCIRK